MKQGSLPLCYSGFKYTQDLNISFQIILSQHEDLLVQFKKKKQKKLHIGQ